MTSKKKALDVRRVQSSLVAVFGKASPPLIWRFDLERSHSFTLALQGEDGNWQLGVTSVKGEFQPVARFERREDADDAFMRVSKTLTQSQFSLFLHLARNIVLFGLAVLLVLALFSAMMQARRPMNTAQQNQQGVSPATAPASAPASPDAPQVGIPLPADEVLKPPTP